jgi:fructose-bisphosphate aldolase, class II
MKAEVFAEFVELLGNSIEISENQVKVVDADRFRKKVHLLAEISALESGVRQGVARYLIRMAAKDLGIIPSSINDLYIARGEGKVPFTFTTPAMNMRVLAFDAAKAVFRAARTLDAAAMIFEIARSEMNYTDQRPTEYTSSILAAAIAEGYSGPVFIQGDHFQVSAKRYAADAEAEIESLKVLITEAMAAGFYNIDVDTSTMVDLSKTTIEEQQKLNIDLSVLLTAFIRATQPKDVEISVGGEIGEVGGHNSTEEELHAYLGGFFKELAKVAPGVKGLSKISIQTGTSHGGVVLPDGSIAKVSVDFDTMLRLSRLSRSEYGLGGAVQHGASTLPEDAFGKFVDAEAVEIHLATNFMNMFYELIPTSLRDEMYAYLREKNAAERKPDMTDEQFYYKTRKSAVGPFKKQSWNLPVEVKEKIGHAWEAQFLKLFKLLGLAGTREYVLKYVKMPTSVPQLRDYLGSAAEAEDVSDLAD